MNGTFQNAASRAEVFRRRFLRVRIPIRSVHYRHRLSAARQTWARNPTGGPPLDRSDTLLLLTIRTTPTPTEQRTEVHTNDPSRESLAKSHWASDYCDARCAAFSRAEPQSCKDEELQFQTKRWRVTSSPIRRKSLRTVTGCPNDPEDSSYRGFFSFEITHCSWNCPNGTTFAASQNWSPLRWLETEIPKYLDLARNLGMPVIPREVMADKPHVNREKVLHHGHPRWRRSGRKSTGHPVRLPSTKASHLRQRCFYRNSTEFASSLKRPQRGTTSKS